MAGLVHRTVCTLLLALFVLSACGDDEEQYGPDHHNTSQAEQDYMNNLLFDQPGFDMPFGDIDLNEEVNIIAEDVLIDSGYLACDQMRAYKLDEFPDSLDLMTVGDNNDDLGLEAWDSLLPLSYTYGKGIPDDVHSLAYSRLLAWNVLYPAIGNAATEELCPEVRG